MVMTQFAWRGGDCSLSGSECSTLRCVLLFAGAGSYRFELGSYGSAEQDCDRGEQRPQKSATNPGERSVDLPKGVAQREEDAQAKSPDNRQCVAEVR